MKLLKHALSTILFATLSFYIWYGTPTLKLVQNDLFNRTYLIALLFIAWLLSLLLFQSNKKTSPADSLSEAESKLKILQGRLQGALQFLQKTTIKKHGKNFHLSHLPWYLLIGSENAGKTSLLAHANIHYILTKQFKKKGIVSTASCDWWATRDLVIVDMPGMYLAEKRTYLWQHLLTLLKKHRGKQAIDAAVIAISVPELLAQKNAAQKQSLAEKMAQKIQELRREFNADLPIYFVITQCDKLLGFLDFFSEYGVEELAQAWGITLPARHANEPLLPVIAQRFNALIKRLNNQLIPRLHQERNQNIKPAIKDFPLQIERLKYALLHFTKSLKIKDVNLQGIYLTSAIQPKLNLSADNILQSNATQILPSAKQPASAAHSYFVKQFIAQALLSKHEKKSPPKSPWRQRAVYAVSFGSILAAMLILGRDFQQSILQTYSIQNNLTHYQLLLQQPVQLNNTLLKALPLLDALQDATQPRNNLSRVTQFLAFYSDKSQKTARTVYQKSLETIVLPEIKNHFERFLAAKDHKNPEQLYTVLKAYLMLGDLSRLQEKYVIDTFNHLITPQPDEKITANLAAHFHTALSKRKKALELNTALIAKIRSHLLSTSPEELGFIILQTKKSRLLSPIHLMGDQNYAFLLKEDKNPIPDLYTANAFSATLTEDIPATAMEVLQGGWVLGAPDVLPNEATLSALTQKLRARYIANYVAIWEGQIANLALHPAKNLTEIDNIIANLVSNTSPLLHFLHTLKEHTSFVPVLNASQKIQNLDGLLSNVQSNQLNPLYQMFVSLRQLHEYLQTILSANDPQKAAFLAAKSRMLNTNNDPISALRTLAAQNPEPIKSWLNTLATDSWYWILEDTSRYIENAWQVNIMTIYRSEFANRFPLNPNATEEVDLQQFANFSGKQGTYITFYQNYLKPFVDDRSKTWNWQYVDHQKLPFSPKALAELQKSLTKLQGASKFQLFAKGSHHPLLQDFKLPEQLSS